MRLMVLGVMVATMVKFTTPLTLIIGESQEVLRDVLDQILPNMLPLGLTFFCFAVLKKGSAPTKVLLGILIAGILGTIRNLLESGAEISIIRYLCTA